MRRASGIATFVVIGLFIFNIIALYYSIKHHQRGENICYMIFVWFAFILFYLFFILQFRARFPSLIAILLPVFCLGVLEVAIGLYVCFPNLVKNDGATPGAIGKSESNLLYQEAVLQSDVDNVYHKAWTQMTPLRDGFRVIHLPPNYRSRFLNLNTQGFRAKEFSQKKSGTYRILFLGGSAAMGWQAISDDVIASNRLEEMLSKQFGANYEFEVFNLAMPSGSSFLDYPVFATYGVELRPDLVIFLTGYNDLNGFAGNIRQFGDVLSGLVLRDPSSRIKLAIIANHLNGLIKGKLHTWRALNELLAPRVPRSQESWVRDQASDPKMIAQTPKHVYDQVRKQYHKNMEKIYQMARRLNVPVAVFQQPSVITTLESRNNSAAESRLLAETKKNTPLYYYNNVTRMPKTIAEARTFADQYGYEYHDLTKVFREYPGPISQGTVVDTDTNGPLFIGNSATHWTVAGNKIIAEAILGKISPRVEADLARATQRKLKTNQ